MPDEDADTRQPRAAATTEPRDAGAEVTRASRLYQAQTIARRIDPALARTVQRCGLEAGPRARAEVEPAPRPPSPAWALATVQVARPAEPGAGRDETSMSSCKRWFDRARSQLHPVLALALALTLVFAVALALVQPLATQRNAARPAAAPAAREAVVPVDPAPAREAGVRGASDHGHDRGGDAADLAEPSEDTTRAAPAEPAADAPVPAPIAQPPAPADGRPPSPHAAAQALAAGRFRDALAAYRGLARAVPSQRAYAHVARVLERRLAQHCGHRAGTGDGSCTRAD